MNVDYDVKIYNEAFRYIVTFIGIPDHNKPYKNHRTFKRSLFDTRYQRDHIGTQPIQLNFKFRVAVPNVLCHAWVMSC